MSACRYWCFYYRRRLTKPLSESFNETQDERSGYVIIDKIPFMLRLEA